MKMMPFLTRVFLGGLFLFSGFSKLVEPAGDFLDTVLGYQIVGGWAAWLLAAVLPWSEMIAGTYLMAGLWTRICSLFLWVMNLVFIAAVGSLILRKISVESCGCFGER